MKSPLIRPAIDTLRNLRGGKTLDELALHITQACAHVKELDGKATVTLEITISPYSKKGTKLKEMPVVMTAEVRSKLPKPAPEGTAFFLDENDNPTLNPPRRDAPELDLRIAGEHTNG